MDNSFYASNDKYTSDRTLDKALEEGRLTEDDRALILEYVREKEASDNISAVRAKKIIAHLVGWRRFLDTPYRKARISDIYEAIAALKGGVSVKGTPFRQNTLHDYIRVLKPFLRWLVESEYSDLPERKILQIRSPSVDHRTTDPDDLITVDEIEALLSAAKSVRDRALIATLYETAARVSELSRLRWKDLAFDKFGTKCYIDDQKTQKRRYVRLTLSQQYLAALKADHPDPDGSSPVFLERGGVPMTYVAVKRVIERAAQAAGIEKRIHPHLFRKSRITHMIAQNYQESVIKESCWGNQDTGMLRTYIQLKENDMDREFLRRAGVEVEEEGDSRRIAEPCPRCHAICGPTFDYCPKCAMPLSPDAKADADAAMSTVMENLDILERVVEAKKRATGLREDE